MRAQGLPHSKQHAAQCKARSVLVAYASRNASTSQNNTNKLHRLKGNLSVPDDSTEPQPDNQQLQEHHNSSPVAADSFPAQQWSEQQQAKQQYRRQQWELWNARQQQLERSQRLKVWQAANKQQRQQTTGDGAEGEQMPYVYDQSRWKVRSKEWREGPPAR